MGLRAPQASERSGCRLRLWRKRAERPLAGGAGGLREQAARRLPRPWKERGKLGHVADALGEALRRRPCVQASPQAASVASRPASSLSKAMKTREQPRRAAATRSTFWVPRAATAGTPQQASASQSKTPSATTNQGGAGPRLTKSKHGLRAGGSLEPWPHVGVDGPSREPVDKTAGNFGNDHHACEPLTRPAP